MTRSEVEALLADPTTRARGLRKLALKTVLGFALLIGAWVYVVFVASSLVAACAGFVALLLGGIMISVCVLHDANHGAFFSSKYKNYVLGWTVDVVLGFSSYFWRKKHTLHHAYPNVDGIDDDIAHQPLARMAPTQPMRRWYRWQTVYIWGLYALALPRWHVTDLLNLTHYRARLQHSYPRGWNLAGLVLGKILFVSWVFLIPLMRHSWQAVVLGYLAFTCCASLIMAIVFQLAHCVEESDFVSEHELRAMPRVWAVHEVQSTSDFAPTNNLVTWLFGALNFQIEHHLFPRVPHTLYPEIAPIVRRNAEKYGVRYTAHPTLRKALGSHWRLVKTLSKQEQQVEIEMG